MNIPYIGFFHFPYKFSGENFIYFESLSIKFHKNNFQLFSYIQKYFQHEKSQSMVSTISSIIKALYIASYILYVYVYVLASSMCSSNLKIKGDDTNRDDSFTSIILKGASEKGLWKEKS